WLIFATSPKGEAFETFPASPSGEVPSVSEAEGFLFLCNFQICSFIVKIFPVIDKKIQCGYNGVTLLSRNGRYRDEILHEM
ncbi:MAG: hypothetical protein VZR73_04905, partial [Acutalibacteraceae bacterium]|nr:hypothetical protein [Acutalibacteraceae bacterium]